MTLFILRYDFSAGGGPVFGVTLEEILNQSSDVMAVIGFYKIIYKCEPIISKWERPTGRPNAPHKVPAVPVHSTRQLPIQLLVGVPVTEVL